MTDQFRQNREMIVVGNCRYCGSNLMGFADDGGDNVCGNRICLELFAEDEGFEEEVQIRRL